MSTTQTTSVSTENVKGLEYTSEGEDAKKGQLVVSLTVTVPESLEEACGEEFYGSEEAAIKTIQMDWQRRCVNAARPILREAESELNWEIVAQQAADGYKPGRRGGFQPRITEDQLDDINDVDALKEFIRKQGLVRDAA